MEGLPPGAFVIIAIVIYLGVQIGTPIARRIRGEIKRAAVLAEESAHKRTYKKPEGWQAKAKHAAEAKKRVHFPSSAEQWWEEVTLEGSDEAYVNKSTGEIYEPGKKAA